MAALPPITQLAGNHRALFEGYWTLVDPAGSGSVPANIAADFLKKSQLREPVLHKVWNLSDPKNTGCLDKQGFFMSLRLVAACQLGKDPDVTNISLTDPPPRFTGVDPTSQGKWTIDKDEQAKFEQLFQSLKPSNGLLPGDKARPFMLQSKLPMDVLGKVWNLSDIDKDGKLDKEEFSVAMKLIALAQAGEILPPSLPSSLIPPSKTKKPVATSSAGSATILPVTTVASHSPHTSIPGSPVPARKVEWVVTPELKSKYDTYFQGIDTDHDGYVTGEQARGLFMASSLPPPQLAHIWQLCDIEKTGRLNAEQFALAMFIIAEKVRGKELPTELTPAMIPPSLQKATPPNNIPAQSTATSLTNTSSGWGTSGLAWSSTPSLSVAMATSVADTSTAWSGGQQSELISESFEGGFSSDFSAIKELDTVAKEVESIRKEKVHLSEEIKSKQELVLQRKAEVESLQSEVDNSVQHRERLEKERLEAQSKLDELDREKTRVDSEIAELRSKCEEEMKEIERLKAALTSQESSKKTQSEELDRMKTQLEALKKEEREYKEKVDTSAAELDKLQKAHQNIQTQISQTRQKIDAYKEEHQTLTHTLSMFPSTPSSTRSSSIVNINDMGLSHLPSELTVPHITEQDAISARATAGSSSPVSSISGFSTNSHLDEGVEDSSVGGGAKTEDKRTVDPFAQNSNDPFAAFALPPGDPFASAQGGAFKPSNLSAFDPFGTSDPFKSTPASSAPPPVDLFKDDPFGVAASKASALPTSSATSTDPFSGQDPFSSDPFATTEKKSSEQPGGWGAFPMDPFASQSDPFSSTDPFGDDPFSNKQSEPTRNNVFQQEPTQSSKDVKVPDALPKPGPHASNSERMRWAKRESEREEALRKKRQLEEEEAIAKAIRDSIKNS